MQEVGLFKALCRAVIFLSLILSIIIFSAFMNGLKINLKLKGKVNQFIVRLIAKSCSIKIHFDTNEMRKNSQKKTSLFLSNHLSYLDVIVLGSLFRCNFLSKQEIASWPFIGRCARLAGCEFVQRDSLQERVTALFSLRRRLKKENFCIFPEGSTTSSSFPSKSLWHRGQVWSAIQNNTRIICLGISYDDQDQISWIDDMEFVPHLWSILKRRETKVYVHATELNYSQNHSININNLSNTAFSEVSRMCQKSLQMRHQSTSKISLLNHLTGEGVPSCSR